MKRINLLCLLLIAVGLSTAGCGGKAPNEVIVADPEINYAGDYTDDDAGSKPSY